MKCFEVWVNGQRLYAAGMRDGHLHGHVHCWNREGIPLSISFGGIDPATDDHLRWPTQQLQVGDEVMIRVVERDEPDEPKRTPQDRERMEQLDREAHDRLKAQFDKSNPPT